MKCPHGRGNKKANIECLRKADPKELVAAEWRAVTDRDIFCPLFFS